MSVRKAFQDYGRAIKKDARKNLKKWDKIATKNLYDSMKFKTELDGDDEIVFSFFMEDYGTYVDRGVKGVGGTKADGSKWKLKKVKDSPFKYRNKRPPASAFDKWTINKGIAPRNKKGQFTSRRGLNFAIAESVYRTGLETTNFLTDAVKSNTDILNKAIDEAMDEQFNNIFT